MTDFLHNGTSFFRSRRRVTDHTLSPIKQESSLYADIHASSSTLTSGSRSTPDKTSTPDNTSRPTTAIRTQGDSPDSPSRGPLHLSPSKRNHRRDSSLSSFSDFKSSLRNRSNSVRSKVNLVSNGRETPTLWDRLGPADKVAPSYTTTERRYASASRPHLFNTSSLSTQPSIDSAGYDGASLRQPMSAVDSQFSKPDRAWNTGGVRPDGMQRSATALGAPFSASSGNRTTSASHPSSTSQDPRTQSKRIADICRKRISLLNYLRMIHASQTHWFNTYRFTPSQLASLPSMHPSRLTRRTQSLFHLGLSLPFALDPNAASLPDYLRALSALLTEYETYTTLHPPDGAPQSALIRARMPAFFKRGVSASKARRGSSADGLLTSPQGAEDRAIIGAGGAGLPPTAGFANMALEDGLVAGEQYDYLLTPSLPFEVDYREVFGTVCEVLCDIYRHLSAAIGKQSSQDDGGGENGVLVGSGLVSAPPLPAVIETFNKVDAKIKKLVLTGLVREFEEAGRQGMRSEIAGLGKLVLGGFV